MKPLKILFVSSEVRPFAMSGGLGDVSGALPKYISARGHDVKVIMPLYGAIDRTGFERLNHPLGVPLGHGQKWCGILKSKLPQSDVDILFLENNSLFDRNGLYGDEKGEFGDNVLRFSVLSKGALQICHYLGWYPDVIHVNDWQTSLIPAYLNSTERYSELGKAGTLLTIHNLGYQGRFSSEKFGETGVPWELFTHLGYEYYDALNLLKGGIYHSTLINAVSSSYAHEIQTPELGEGLDGVLREKGAFLYGIVNGIDNKEWDPETDKLLPSHFSSNDLSGKLECKRLLQMETGLEVDDNIPLVSIISRLAWQKGIDVVIQAFDKLMDLGIQFILVGTGDRDSEYFFSNIENRYPKRAKGIIDFNTSLAHRVEAGSDLFLMPSRYEPCGLNQIYSLRYGTLPIVRATGGLNDTVENYDQESGTGTGFKFWDLTPNSVEGVVSWACETFRYRKEHFFNMQQRAMSRDWGWEKSAEKYEELYYRASYFRKR